MKKIVEEWKTIEGFPNYEISNFGKCRNIKYKKILKVVSHTLKHVHAKYRIEPYTSYEYSIWSEGRGWCRSVSMLVAKHFVPNPNGYKQIRHKDGDSSNFIYTNLEWVKTHIPEDRSGNHIKKHHEGAEQIAFM
jgi:hypothetical protein